MADSLPLNEASCHFNEYLNDFDILREQHALKNVNNYLNINIYSYLKTSGDQSSIPYLNVVHFFDASVN
jgi:hypothetical protein